MDDQHDIDCGCQEYNELSRRQFLGRAAGVSAAAFFPDWLPKIVMAKNYASNRDIIVSVFMRGGADGLSLVRAVRRRRTTTRRARRSRFRGPTRRPPRRKGINLDNFFVFPQAMAGGLVPAYQPAFQAGPARSCTRRDSSTTRARTSTRSDTWKSASRSTRRS